MTVIAKCALRKTGQFLWTNLGVNSKLSLVFVPSASASYMRATYGESFGYPKPFPYEKKKYTMASEIFDKTTHRFNENTKAILIEGGPGVGKNEFAHRFAKQFDLKVFESVNDDSLWVDRRSGYDLRILNEFLPPKLGFYTTKMFYENPSPTDQLGCKLQFQMYEEKFRQYCSALQHLLNTGQGVVIVRSVWSDFVYAEAMRACGFMSDGALNYYNDLKMNSICELIKPHLTIYLDSPIQTWKDRTFEKTGYGEKNSPAFNDTYLSKLDSLFKKKFLPEMKKHGEVLQIDWSERADDLELDIIVQEVKSINLGSDSLDESKFLEWYRNDEDDWSSLRKSYGSDDQIERVLISHSPDLDCPELVPTDEEIELIQEISEHPILNDKPGWSETLGNKPTWRFF